ncbi:uncharacterized protein LOC118478419 [Aplysia californica]|uniref:Uncharacterized protein LOC118478419 n=1 Tax=Aplysia californica TaxID=6500 RepID=A0ABM1VZN6_APLCA|nr:uncharacterized protein LOC118478419 [Aplysia californica]
MLCLAVLSVALVSLVGAQSSDGGSGYYLHGYLPANVLVDPLLDRLNRYIGNLESREGAQLSRLGRLSAVSNQNRDFQNLFQNTLSRQIADRQKIHGQRIGSLQYKIAELKALRQQVQSLISDASALGNVLQEEIYPTRKQVMYDINDLQNADIERLNRIEQAQTRANAISDRIDVVWDKATENGQTLSQIKLSVRRAINSVNRQKSAEEELLMDPKLEQYITVNFDFQGAPQFAQSLLTGFELVRTYSGYSNGYPCIYVGVENVLKSTQAGVDSVDMSSGGWSANTLNGQANFIYFDTLQNNVGVGGK